MCLWIGGGAGGVLGQANGKKDFIILQHSLRKAANYSRGPVHWEACLTPLAQAVVIIKTEQAVREVRKADELDGWESHPGAGKNKKGEKNA